MAKGFLTYGQQVGKLVNEKGLAVSRPRLEARTNGSLCCSGSVLGLMARMQHYGGARRRLFDAASSLDVAHCFALSRHDEVTGVVYSCRVNPDMRVSIGEQSDGREPDWYELADRCRGGPPARDTVGL